MYCVGVYVYEGLDMPTYKLKVILHEVLHSPAQYIYVEQKSKCLVYKGL